MVFEKILGHLLNSTGVKKSFGKIINLIAAFLIALLSFSCLTTKPLYIEIPRPSKKELPKNIQSLLIISRVADENYSDLEADSLQKIFYNQQFNLDTVINDIQCVDTTLKALGELLFESGRYDFVIPENRFLAFEKNAFITGEMPWDQVKTLCGTFKTDAILSLDYLKTQVTTSYKKENYYSIVYSRFYPVSQATMKISYDALFRVYDPVQEKIVLREILRDTITWEDEDTSAGTLFERFSQVKNGLAETGIAIALDLSGEIGSKWYTDKRNYFANGNEDMKSAGLLINAGRWDTAIALWKDIAEKAKKKSLKSKAEFNIALGYEMIGDLDSAIGWALQSYNTHYRSNTYYYLETLKYRKNDINKQ